MARAVRFEQFGGTEVLQVVDVPVPTADEGRVVVEVRAAGLNPGEASIRQGYLEQRWPTTFPCGEGTDFAGVVHEVGAGVTGLAVGDAVLGWSHERSSHAQFVAVPADQLVPKPASLSFEVAGSLQVAGTTAVAAVRAVGAGPGDTVVVAAAAGGVGSIAVQLLRRAGADVIGIASPANHDWLRSVGVVPVAYGEGLLERVRAAAPGGVDAFLDLFGPDYVRLALDLGVAPERIDTIISFALAAETGIKAEGSAQAGTPEVLAELADLAASGALQVPIAATYPLEQVREAFTELEQRHTRGKIVLLP